MYTIVKQHRFEAAHRLVNDYPGNCKHLHGHSWVVDFTVKGDDLDSYGMLYDFGAFKEIRKWIDDNLDHATIACDTDTTLNYFLSNNDQRKFITPLNPTSEHLCKVIFEKCLELNIPIYEVSIHETCTSKATYGR